MSMRWILGFSCLIVAAGCGGVSDDDDDVAAGDGDGDSDGDGDTDADGDGDTDGDGDGDADADADGDADGDADDTTLEGVCDQISEVLCESSAACCVEGWTPQEITICIDSFSLNCQAGMNTAVATGTVTIDPDSVDACIDAFSAAWGACPEGEVNGLDGPCADVFVGTIDAGGVCDSDEECVAGLECAYPRDGDPSCQRMPVAGAACLNGDCANGNQCNYRDDVCYLVGHLGDACEVFDQYNDSCEYDLHCAGGTCRADFEAGHACSESRECLGNNCLQDAAGAPLACSADGGEPRDWCDASSFTEH